MCGTVTLPVYDFKEPIVDWQKNMKSYLVILMFSFITIMCNRFPPPQDTHTIQFSPPSESDANRLAKQWLFIDSLVSNHYGASLDQSLEDLNFLQRLLDDNVLLKDQTWELQSLGVVMGRVLAHNHPNLDWWIIEDKNGRDPTIRYEKTTLRFNVLTMISKRIEKDESVDVRNMYDQTIKKLDELKDQVD